MYAYTHGYKWAPIQNHSPKGKAEDNMIYRVTHWAENPFYTHGIVHTMLFKTIRMYHLSLPAKGSALNHNHCIRHPVDRTMYVVLPRRIVQLTIKMSSHYLPAITCSLPICVCLERDIKRICDFFHVVVKRYFSLWEETFDLIDGGRY